MKDGIITVADLAERVRELYDRPGPTRDTNPENKRLTLDDLIAREPRLADLRRRVRAERGGPGYCANEAWYGPKGYRREVIALVGNLSESDDAALRTSAAYDAAYQTLYRLLPDCDHDDSMCRRGRR